MRSTEEQNLLLNRKSVWNYDFWPGSAAEANWFCVAAAEAAAVVSRSVEKQKQGKVKSVLQSRGTFPRFCVTKFNMTLIKLMKIDVSTPLQDQQFILKSDQTRYFDLGNSYVSSGLKQMKSKTRQQWPNPIWNARVSKIPLSGNLVRRYCLWHLQPLGEEKDVTHPPVYETESRGAPSIKRCCILSWGVGTFLCLGEYRHFCLSQTSNSRVLSTFNSGLCHHFLLNGFLIKSPVTSNLLNSEVFPSPHDLTFHQNSILKCFPLPELSPLASLSSHFPVFAPTSESDPSQRPSMSLFSGSML